MNLLPILAQAHELTKELNPDAVRSRIIEWRKGGYPSNSIAAGTGHSTDTMLPLPDRVDAALASSSIEYGKAINQAHRALERAMRIQNAILIKAPALPEAVTLRCSNLACDKNLEAGRKKGECSRCRVHRHRHNVQWPNQREGVA